jgi:hypothetical protein
MNNSIITKIWGESLEERFKRLRDKWKEETVISSKHLFDNDNYQEIIGLGSQVIPLLIHELRTNPHWWFEALRSITGHIPESCYEHSGCLDLLTQDWIAWADSYNIPKICPSCYKDAILEEHPCDLGVGKSSMATCECGCHFYR